MNLDRTYDQTPPDRDQGPTVLIVDDEELCRQTLRAECSQALQERTFRLLECGSIDEAIRILSEQEVHAILLDKKLGDDLGDPNQNGILSIPRLLSMQPHLQILMVTGSDDDQDIVDAMRNGAFGYVLKGSKPGLLTEQIKNAVRYAMLSQDSLRSNHSDRAKGRKGLVGGSPAITQLGRQVEALAKTETSVLLQGETGTGKTTVAELIHELRQLFLKQESRPFIHLNMAAIPENLAESELFGAEKGSFTGCVGAKPGSFELANGGTLFLDEIGDAPMALQKKLLTVLDEGIFKRVGGTEYKKSKFRLICATNKNLDELVKAGLFREDLQMRISTITIRIPSLAERKQDIPQLVKCLLPKCCERGSIRVGFKDLPEDFIEHLKEAPLQGNIRGLVQQIERLLLFAPRDRRGRPIFKLWKSVPGLQIRAKEARISPGGISMDEILERKLDVVGDKKFPGLFKFIEVITKQIFSEAHKKLETSSERARVLNVSQSVVSRQLQAIGLSPRKPVTKRSISSHEYPSTVVSIQEEVRHE